MSTSYLLDTSTLMHLLRGRNEGIYIKDRFRLNEAPIALISVVTHGEIAVLARSNNWGPAKMSVLERALSELVTMDINQSAVLDAYVEIDIFSQKAPGGARKMGKNDLWIAACAKASGSTLITFDKDFSHLSPSLVRVEYVPLQPVN